MQRFLISIIVVTVVSWTLLFFFMNKIGTESAIFDLTFAFLLFIAAAFTLSLVIYFGRIFLTAATGGRKIKVEEEEADLRPIWRRSFKMSLVISAFLAVAAFLKLEDQLNLLNFGLLLIIIIFGTILFRH